ncbi:MAG: hypothetical protein K1000chlam2_01802 [Chlamydiae bacterium]|nr:hypothetical protein [Chlamydiota bacterium]
MAILFSLIGSGALFLAAIFSHFVTIGKRGRSIALHFAAGVVFAAVSRELLPKVMQFHQPIDLSIGFAFGVIVMLLVGLMAKRLEKGSSMGMLTAVGVDLWIDGILIGVAFLAGRQSGILVAISLAFCALFLGLSVSASLKSKKASRSTRIGAPLILALLLPFGVFCGTSILSILPEKFFIGTLAFGIAALLYLVTEELLAEAHQVPETPRITVMFFAGFLLVLLI